MPPPVVTVKTPVPAELPKLTSTVAGVAGFAGAGFGERVTVTVCGKVPVVGVILMPGLPPGVPIEPVQLPVPERLTVADWPQPTGGAGKVIVEGDTTGMVVAGGVTTTGSEPSGPCFPMSSAVSTLC